MPTETQGQPVVSDYTNELSDMNMLVQVLGKKLAQMRKESRPLWHSYETAIAQTTERLRVDRAIKAIKRAAKELQSNG